MVFELVPSFRYAPASFAKALESSFGFASRAGQDTNDFSLKKSKTDR